MNEKLTMFKRGLMRALIDDENLLKKLGEIGEKIALEAFEHEEAAKRRRNEQIEVQDLILFLSNKESK